MKRGYKDELIFFDAAAAIALGEHSGDPR